MIKKGIGGANTQTGLVFEQRVDFTSLIKQIPNYSVRPLIGKAGSGIFYKNELVARSFKKTAFYHFLTEEGIDYGSILSKRLYPDDAILIIIRKTLFIIEVKYQFVEGSVDEKLQTCDFKRKQYQKLVQPIGLKVEYVYVLNEWFENPKYKDVLNYINSVNCHYQFNKLPLEWLGLPTK